jgi:hypothetical protein
MAVFPGTTVKDIKHGEHAYNKGCRCDVCCRAKSEKTKKRKQRLFGKLGCGETADVLRKGAEYLENHSRGGV